MTRGQWKSKRYRRVRNRRASIFCSIEQLNFDMLEVESVGPVYINMNTNDKRKILMYRTITMKSGKEHTIKKYFDRMYHTVQFISIFRNEKIKKVEYSPQDYFSFYRKNPDTLGGEFFKELNTLAKDFLNNVVVLRRY